MVVSAMATKETAPRKQHVLIVDDNLDLTYALRRLLEARNYEVSVVPNGVLGLKEVLLKEVDLVLCDLKMPELEGDQFYSAVKRIKPHLSTRFIFITGMAADPKFESFLSSVQSPVLQKPVATEKLLGEMHRMLEQRLE